MHTSGALRAGTVSRSPAGGGSRDSRIDSRVRRGRPLLVLVAWATPFSFICAQASGVGPSREEQLRLAKLLENPVANLISVPIQNNFDFGIGRAKALRWTLNIQPVIPFTLGRGWNLITRTIVPMIYAGSPVPGGESRFGLSDITQSFFFSPSRPVRGLILGAGPVIRYPTASDRTLGGEKWGAGPTVLLIQQKGSWTYGGLANHLWSFAGSGSRGALNATFLQPAIAYNFKTATTLAIVSESLYDWTAKQWIVPVNFNAAQMTKIGTQPVRVAVGARYYAVRPQGGARWGARFQLVFPLPK